MRLFRLLTLYIALTLGATFATSLAATGIASAADNPFAQTELPGGYMVAEKMEGQCGAGMKGKAEGKMEGQCGAGMAEKAEGKAKGKMEGQCGEGKCGAGMMQK